MTAVVPPAPPTSEAGARALLRELFGHREFHPGQWEPIRAVLQGRDALVVMPTGPRPRVLRAPQGARRRAVRRRRGALREPVGHDFRLDYLTLGSAAERLGRPPILALTATATDEVRQDIVRVLGMRDPLVLVTGFERPNLRYEVRRTANADAKEAELDAIFTGTEGNGIIYCATVKEAGRLYRVLTDRYRHRYAIGLYHGQQGAHERTETQERFMVNGFKAMIATNAFGMGVDKPDVRFVAHYQFPGSLEAYYQEAGRAGRDGEWAVCPIL